MFLVKRMVRERPLILGLTGSIAMGKSETAKMFRYMQIPVFDSDAVVHRLLERGGLAVRPVAESFPGVVKDNNVDRAALAKQVFSDPRDLATLEKIIHPLVYDARAKFLSRAKLQRKFLVVIDVPLLFETGGQNNYHAVLVVSAPKFVQRQRAFARPNMSPEKLNSILRRQMPDALKRLKADYVVSTGVGKRATWRDIGELLRRLRSGAVIGQRRRFKKVRRA